LKITRPPDHTKSKWKDHAHTHPCKATERSYHGNKMNATCHHTCCLSVYKVMLDVALASSLHGPGEDRRTKGYQANAQADVAMTFVSGYTAVSHLALVTWPVKHRLHASADPAAMPTTCVPSIALCRTNFLNCRLYLPQSSGTRLLHSMARGIPRVTPGRWLCVRLLRRCALVWGVAFCRYTRRLALRRQHLPRVLYCGC
jgi:hypothetical protein